MDFDLELVRPITEHAKLVFEWRNDPVTRQNSFHTESKEWESFKVEFQAYFRFPDLPPLFAVVGAKKVAFLRFDPVQDFAAEGFRQRRSCSLSINVGPEYRGSGIGSALLNEIKTWIYQQGYEALYGEVKVNNNISRKAFLKAGFRELPESIKIVDERQPVPIVRFVAEFVPIDETRPPVLIVAEAGSNWRMGNAQHDLKMAKLLIEIAAEAGADAVKFQVFKPKTIYVENAGSSGYLSGFGITESINALFTDIAMPYEMIAELHSECLHNNIEFMATSFSRADFEAVDPFVQRHKISSYELNHPHLLELAARSQKPLLLSTGAATEEEIAWAVKTFFQHRGSHLTLLQCTARYPAPPTSMHLSILPWLRSRFNLPVGLSDHSQDPYCAPIMAVALGARAVEKHFTLDRRLPGPDHAFALQPEEFSLMVRAIRLAEQMNEGNVKEVDPIEAELRLFARRGIQAIKDISEGEVLREGENIDILRPGEQTLGVSPRFLPEIEGKTSLRAIPLGDGIRFGDFL